MNGHLYFILFSNCVPVRGIAQSIICDLQSSAYKFIPNILYDIFTIHKSKTIFEIKSFYLHEYDQGIDNYFRLLEDRGWGFWTNTIETFPQFDLSWDSPYLITNSLMDIVPHSTVDYMALFNQLDTLGCEAIQIRSYNVLSFEFLTLILSFTEKKRFKCIQLIIKFDASINEENIFKLLKKNPRIQSILIHSSPHNMCLKDTYSTNVIVEYTMEQFLSSNCCGNIHTEYFNLNVPSFTESQHHNTCLNRKISIDVDGNIKNCPSMKESFGNIKDTTLEEALNKKGFKKYWNIKKDDIAVCKDCEFRHICTDCRAYLENPNDKYSKPLKCGYDPYTATWSEWSTNPLKQKAIEHYGMQELVKSTQVKKKKSV